MSPGVLERRWQVAIRLTVAALVWSVQLLLAALPVGAYRGQTMSSLAGITSDYGHARGPRSRSARLVLLPVAVCGAAAIALWDRRRLATPATAVRAPHTTAIAG